MSKLYQVMFDDIKSKGLIKSEYCHNKVIQGLLYESAELHGMLQKAKDELLQWQKDYGDFESIELIDEIDRLLEKTK